MIHALEPRRLFAVSVSYDSVTQVLSFVGDEKRDSIAFARTDPTETLRAVVNGVEQIYTDPISQINVSAGDGADTVIGGQITIPMFIRGGRGPDTLSGGRGNDTIFGDGGFDVIVGRQGDDILAGGLQGDVLFGSACHGINLGQSAEDDNDDSIAGGAGTDTLDYSALPVRVLINVGDFVLPDIDVSDRVFGDVEVLIGTDFNDRLVNGTRRGMTIDGRGGNDTILGGSGNDTLTGGPGTDSIAGFGGPAFLHPLDGISDAVDGGRDFDTATVDQGLDALFNLESVS